MNTLSRFVRLAVLTLLMLPSTQAHAWDLGFHIGMTDFGPIDKSNPEGSVNVIATRSTINIGVDAHFQGGGVVGVEAGLWFVPRAFRRLMPIASLAPPETEEESYGTQWLMLPVLATVTTGPIRFGIGPYAGMLLSQSFSQSDYVSIFGGGEHEYDDDDGEFSGFDFGIMARANAAYPISEGLKFNASVLLTMGLANLVDTESDFTLVPFGVKSLKARDFMVTIGLSWEFGS